MPTFAFKCDKCEHVFEKFLKQNEQEPDTCPVCDGPITKQLFATPFKGSGGGWAGSKGQRRGNV